jgi:hypothetical protein
MVVSSGFVHQQQIDEGVRKAVSALNRKVVRIRYNLGEDWSGGAAVFFRVLLKDAVSKRPSLRDVAREVAEMVAREVRPSELGLEVYYNFRSESEQETLQEAAWA